MTKSEFIKLAEQAAITSGHEIAETTWTGNDSDPEMVWGWIWNSITVDGCEIVYQNSYEHPKGKPSEAETSSEVQELWAQNGSIEVLDEDGDPLDLYDLGEILLQETKIDLWDTQILGEDQTEDIDIDEEGNDMQTYTVQRDNDLDIRFTGELIASATSTDNNVDTGAYSGSVGRWSELALYRTKGGKLICEQVGKTRWQGEHDRHSAAACDTEAEVIAFFGTGWLAKELYEKAGIEAVQEID